jgi:hypothetical protein
MSPEVTLRRIRVIVAVFIVGLFLSGVTAFPLLYEMNLLAKILGLGAATEPSSYSGLNF